MISRLLAVVCALLVARATLADSTVVFNEIMYNPKSGDKTGEWIELYNQMSVDIDMSRWSLTKGVEFTFPEGTVLKGGKFFVIAADPEAMKGSAGLTQVFGPFVGKLASSGELLELRNHNGRVMDSVKWETDLPWPVGADGAGATLAKRALNLGSANPKSWTVSSQAGGTPGIANFLTNTLPTSVRFSEVTGSGTGAFWVELENFGSSPVPLKDFKVLFAGSTNLEAAVGDLVLSSNAFFVPDLSALKLQVQSGDRLFLYGGTGELLDALVIKKSVRARSVAHAGEWWRPVQPTPGAANILAFNNSIVINEIMYHARATNFVATTNAPEQWIELYNKTAKAVDISGWKLDEGIEFEFEKGTTIPAQGFLVVAKDANALRTLYPDITIVGDFTKTLSGNHDVVLLLDDKENVADQAEYYDAYPWPKRADGGGSSLERRDPRADGRVAANWAASDESKRTGWKQYSYSGVAGTELVGGTWKEFIFGLLDAGELLLDDFSVIEDPNGTKKQLLKNGGFENGEKFWRFRGTHRTAEVIEDPENAQNHLLHLTASGPTEHMHNHVETTFTNNTGLVSSRTYAISYRAKWLAGNNQLNTRLYFNRVARTTELEKPLHGGTPGRANSSIVTNSGPTLSELSHFPVIPPAAQPITIRVAARDEDSVAKCTIFWRLGNGNWNQQPMIEASPGRFEGMIPAQVASSTLQFYVEAVDALGAVAYAPMEGPNARALIRTDDKQANLTKTHNVRLIMLPAEVTTLHATTNVMSNEPVLATVVYDEQEVFYNVHLHLQASERGRSESGRVGFTIAFPADHLFRGVHDGITLDRSGGYSGIGGKHDEILMRHVLNQAGGGLPDMYNDLVRCITPRASEIGTAMLIMAKYGPEFLDNTYEDGAKGHLFKIELVYSPNSTVGSNPENPKLPQPDDVVGADFQNLGNDKEPYRWFFVHENHSEQDDYSRVMEIAKMFDNMTGLNLDAKAKQLLDVDQWLRSFAAKTLSGDADTYGWGYTHNQMFYIRPSDGRMLAFPWDMDYSWARPSGDSIYPGAKVANLVSTALPANRRRFQGHVHDIAARVFNKTNMAPWATMYGTLVGQNFTNVLNYIGTRSAAAVRQLPAQIPFSILTTDAQIIASNVIPVRGKAWVNVRRILFNNQELPLTWVTADTWEALVPLAYGANNVSVVPLNFQSQPLTTNVFNAASTTVGGRLDSDGDGIPDEWERAMSLDPKRNDSSADPDKDGLNNYQEYLAGTDPADRNEAVRLSAAWTGDKLNLNFMAVAGRRYRIENRPLNAGPWTMLQAFDPRADSRMITHEVTPASQTGFFRLVLDATN